MTRYGTTPHDTDAIVALRYTCNENERAFSDLRTIHSDDQRRIAAEYDALMAQQRPTFPTEEQLRGLDMVASIVRGDVSYGEHHGWPQDVDREVQPRTPPSSSILHHGEPDQCLRSRAMPGDIHDAPVGVHQRRYPGAPG